MLLRLSQSFPLPSSTQYPPVPLAIPPQFMSMGHAYMFFGFSISYTILILSLSILCLLLCFLCPIPFLPILLLPLPADNPPCDLHFCGSVLVLVVFLVFVF